MSYLVLARKWRPRVLEEVVGQDHVVRTLTHALDNQRLHHAYLFTGTRGVGKTTLARILAKALNCEQGVSSKPCNECTTCIEIDEGRFIDLIEVDAASRTKVEDTRALLDNVPYQTTSGRYKIYLIDEIHMLSGHSFNALLKTLEEPPAHVKFLMATTDPQKLPVTVLSRCIQFNLRAMDVPEIAGQLEKILEAEKQNDDALEFETTALESIARLAKGSMRDGLSILDQAISFTGSKLQTALVRDMLGMISREFLFDLLRAIANRDADQILDTVSKMCEQSINFESTLDDVLLELHNLALYQISPSIVRARGDSIEFLSELAQQLSDEDVQLFYQIGLISKRDLTLAPDPRSGFEMALMRMLAFRPESQSAPPPKQTAAQSRPTTIEPSTAASNTLFAADSVPTQSTELPALVRFEKLESPNDWNRFVTGSDRFRANLGVVAKKLKFHSRSGNQITLSEPSNDSAYVLRDQDRNNLRKILCENLGEDITIAFVSGANENESPEQLRKREDNELAAKIRSQIEMEPLPRFLQDNFGATIDPNSVRPNPTNSN